MSGSPSFAFPPKLDLYYSPKACSLASHIALEESGLAYEAVSVNIRNQENRREEYLRLNPGGTVPTLGIDGRPLTESQAILTYIADLVPERQLLPRPGTLARARAHEWMNLISSSLHVSYRSVFRPQTYGGEDPAAMEHVQRQGRKNLAKYLALIESRLDPASAYALGETFTVVDAYLFVFYLWSYDERLQCDLPERPRYRALAERVAARPAVRKVVARERCVRAYDLPDHILLDDAQDRNASVAGAGAR